MPDFLLELGLEEIPARMIAGAEAELARRVTDLFTRESLLGSGDPRIESYSTPRRLAVLVHGVSAVQPDREEELTGPAAKVAYKDGRPTPAAFAFAKKAGVEVEALRSVATPKGEYVAATVYQKGKTAATLIEEQLPREIGQLYWAKSMYWRPGKPERFVRPVQWIVALLDQQIIPVDFAGVTAGKQTQGHRILYGDQPVTIAHPSAYLPTLQTVFVQADAAARRHRIRKALDTATRTVAGARWREDEPLVETVTQLTEWPTVVLDNFEAEYLSLPEEVLVTVMRDHQKYFAVEDATGKLAPCFLAVLNTEVDADGQQIIRHGNARVLRARFNDARFFWNYDQKTSLVDRVPLLKNVTFQKDLGSYFEKTEANARVAEVLADLASKQGVSLDREALLKAVHLAKADLTAELVKEFTELQGMIGGLYARAQGHGEAVAQAIYAQYQPASTEGAIPSSVEGQLLGLADRMQTIVSMFSIGLQPTGSKDPFALRRGANGVIRILAESVLPLHLGSLVEAGMLGVAAGARSHELAASVRAFLNERLEFYLREVDQMRYDVVNAVLAAGSDDLQDVRSRARALTEARGSEDFLAVSSAFKRMKNILRQSAEKHPGEVIAAPSQVLLADAEEKHLHATAAELASRVSALQSAGNYGSALQEVAKLRPVIDAFFDKVMVMTPDDTLRKNRLGLIQQTLDAFSRIGDFSEIAST